eukprot:m.88844 g.88844  ORF g.88844 m.88844 type:complete len:278 (+) comp15204_c0_seq1:234-1067(+)
MAHGGGSAPSPADLKILENVECFHGPLSRHVAESLLRHNGVVGTFLLRLCSEEKECLGLSVRGTDNVFHFIIRFDGQNYAFGTCVSPDVNRIVEHIYERPTLDVGQKKFADKITLTFPYPREVSEPKIYERTPQSLNEEKMTEEARRKLSTLPLSVSGKEGWLTKLGRVKKNWKMRWFVLEKNILSYYKAPGASKPCGEVINMADCVAVQREFLPDLKFCFSVRTSTRTLLMYSDSQEATDSWISILLFKQERFSKSRPSSMALSVAPSSTEPDEDD